MIHPTPTKVLLTTTFEPLVRQLSGSLARGVRLIEQFLHDEPTPTTTMIFERELSALLREVGLNPTLMSPGAIRIEESFLPLVPR